MNIDIHIKKANIILKKSIKKGDITKITNETVNTFLLKGRPLTRAQTKMDKSKKFSYRSTILHLAPETTFDKINLCPWASAGCKKACLISSGRLRMALQTRARLIRTLAFIKDRQAFIKLLKRDIGNMEKTEKRKGNKLTVRLNGTSDIRWHEISDIIESYPNVQFYDYTKGLINFETVLPLNYHLTFSLSESNIDDALKVLDYGANVAVVFRTDEFPEYWNGYQVINGDEHDLRFLDKENVVVGLKAKGKARKDESGFVQEIVEDTIQLVA